MEMRSSINLFQDQYEFYKELKSEKLLVAFVEYMFEDKEPQKLNSLETTIFNSLRNRMENSKALHDRNSKWWKSSHGGGRKSNASSDAEWKNSLKTTKQTTKEQPKNKEVEVEEELIKENKKRKWFGEFGMCYLTDEEYEKVMREYWPKNWELLIKQVDNYCASKWKKYKNYVAAIRNFAENGWIKKLTASKQNEYEISDGVYDIDKLLNDLPF